MKCTEYRGCAVKFKTSVQGPFHESSIHRKRSQDIEVEVANRRCSRA